MARLTGPGPQEGPPSPPPSRTRTWLRPRSFRFRAIAVVVFVVVAPVALVWLSNLFDRTAGYRLSVNVRACADATAAALLADSLEDADNLAWRHGTRVRVADEGGRVVHDRDYERSNLVAWFTDLFFVDETVSLREHDAGLPPLVARTHWQTALSSGESRGCDWSTKHDLLVCTAVKRVDLADGSRRMVFVQDASRRATRALYDIRYELLKLAAASLVIGILVATWLGARMVMPIEQLRAEILARVAARPVEKPFGLERRDEVGDLARAFDRLMTTLADKNQANEAFIADLAHEMKNPVAAVRAVAESMAEKPVDAARAQRFARVLATSSQRLDRLVTRLLALARAEAGLTDQEREQVNLTELVQGVADNVAADERYTDVSFSVLTIPVCVDAVSTELESAIRNVIDNAASFAGTTGAVEVALSQSGGLAILRVSDSGPGIPPEMLHRVFDRFYTTRADRKGTGLGLAMTRAVLQAHGGQIFATNANIGAVFEIRLPARGESA